MELADALRVHGPDGRVCGRIESGQVTNESTEWIAGDVFSFDT